MAHHTIIATFSSIITGSHISVQNICDQADIPYTPSSLGIPNPTVNFSDLSPDDREDLVAQIDSLTREIHIKFLKLQADLIKSLKKSKITPAQIIQTLKAHTCGIARHSENVICATLFQDCQEELSSAKEVEDVFVAISQYFSYFNYELFQMIVDVHGSHKDKDSMQHYLHDFSAFCEKVPCVEFHHECHHKLKETKRTRIKFKLDYDRNQLKLGDVKRIQRNIAKILKLKPSVLYLHCVEDGCLIFTFILPTYLIGVLIEAIKNGKAMLQQKVRLLYIELDRPSTYGVC